MIKHELMKRVEDVRKITGRAYVVYPDEYIGLIEAVNTAIEAYETAVKEKQMAGTLRKLKENVEILKKQIQHKERLLGL